MNAYGANNDFHSFVTLLIGDLMTLSGQRPSFDGKRHDSSSISHSGRPMPIIFGDNSGGFINWWIAQSKKDPSYETMGQASVPAVGSAAFYVALAVVQGKTVPKNMEMPFLTFTQSNLSDWSNVPMDGMADPKYDYSWVQKNLLNQ